MADAPHDLDGIGSQLAPEREARRQEAAHEMAAILLKVRFEQGLTELEDTVRGAMVGIGEVLGQVEGGNAFMVELCEHFGGLARMLRDRPPTSGVLQ